VIQHIRAEAGFAYGAIGADIHVFANGQPLYLLEEHKAPPVPGSRVLRRLPSRMLNARSRTVPFTGRSGEVAELASWLEADPRVAVRWLYGPGGRGKTRLALEAAERAGRRGWKVATAVHGVGAAARPSPGSQDLRLGSHRGVLLIVDYADRWTLTALTWLLRNALLHQPDKLARVLLLARTTAGWPQLCADLDDPFAEVSTSEQPLAPLPAERSADRRAMFIAARDAFAEVLEVSGAESISPPPELEGPDYGLPLTIQTAALVLVDALATGGRPPSDANHLTRYLLDRERQHWTWLYENRTELDYELAPSVMARTVFTATLTGSLAHADAAKLLSHLENEAPVERIITDHARCYPTIDSSTAAALEPLSPDRLAEDFLALTLLGSGSSDEAQPWAATRLRQLLDPEREIPDGSVARALTFVAAAAARWLDLGPRHLFPILTAQPQLAVRAGSPALVALAAVPDIDPAVLTAIDELLPDDSHVDLDVGAAAISTALIDHRLRTTADPSACAEIHANHSHRLAAAGRPDDALPPAAVAVEIRRRLADTDPTSHLPELAASLHNLANRQAALGRNDEALRTVTEACDSYRRAAEADVSYLLDFAGSLGSKATWLAAVGRQREAVEAARDAVTLLRWINDVDAGKHTADLAIALHSLGASLGELGEWAEARAVAEEATVAYRQLTEVRPEKYRPFLAASLNNLSTFGANVGRDDALPVAEEATSLYRRLAETNPNAYSARFAASLHTLANRLAERGMVEQALSTTQQAVTVRRQLAQALPAAHLADLAASLNNLGIYLRRSGRFPEAIEATREATRIRRTLSEFNPARLPDLGESLHNLSTQLGDVGRYSESQTHDDEAVSIHRRLAEIDPARHMPDLGRALRLYAWSTLAAGADPSRALEALQECTGIYEVLSSQRPGAFDSDRAAAYLGLADTLSRLGHHSEAAMARLLADG